MHEPLPPFEFQWRIERYARATLDRLGVGDLADMGRVMRTIEDDPEAPKRISDLRRAAEEMLKGECVPMRVLPDAEIEAFVAAHERPVAIARVLEAPTGYPRASRFHGVPCLPIGMDWPRAVDGRPMRFLGQFDLDAAGLRPEAVPDTGFLTVFVNPGDPDSGDPEDDQIDPWAEDEVLVVETPSRDAVAPAAIPPGVVVKPAIELGFAAGTSLPGLDDPYVTLPEGITDDNYWRSNLHEAVCTRDEGTDRATRIGGWTHQVQLNFPCCLDDPASGDRYPMVLQIAEEHGLTYGDGGFLYLAKGRQTREDAAGRSFLFEGWIADLQIG